MASSIKKNRVNTGPDKRDSDARTSRADTISINGPQSPIWKSQPEVAAAGATLINAGKALDGARSNVAALENQLIAARGVVATATVNYDKAYGVYASLVETHAAKPEDIPGLGMEALVPMSHPLDPPAGVQATYDIGEGLLFIRVTQATGIRSCVVEISPDPVGPGTWKRLDGFGGVKKLYGYPAGTYWVRAASSRTDKFSAFTTPVAVIVK